jgi:membrane protein implicated in regulation of membrane protease activity
MGNGGYAAYEGAGLMKVLGGFVILVGIGLAGYILYLSFNYWVIALVAFLVLVILGASLISRGSYNRLQNAPRGRVEEFRST